MRRKIKMIQFHFITMTLFFSLVAQPLWAGIPVTEFSAILPNQKLAVIKEALEHSNGTDEVDDVTPLLGGLSAARLFKITVGNQTFVLRLLGDTSSERVVSAHFAAHRLAAEAGLSPCIRYENIEAGVLLMDYIDNQPLTMAQRTDPKMYVDLANTLKRVHQLPSFPGSFSVIEHLRRLARETNTLAPGMKEKVRSLVEKVGFRLGQFKTRPFTPCHHDLNPNNILHDGNQFWVIDWEIGAQGDPFLDLATVSNFYMSDPKTESLYLQTYFGRNPTESEAEKYRLFKNASFLFYGLECMNQSSGISTERGASDYDEAEVKNLPELGEFYADMGAGKVNLSRPADLFKFGMVMLKHALITSNL